MGSTRTKRFHGFTIPRKWVWELIETDKASFCQRVGNVARFNPPSKETFDWEELDRDVWGDLDETRER
jgi:hypothetical protein